MFPWKLRKRQILPVSQNLSSVYFLFAKFQLVSCNLSFAIIWQMTYTQKLPKLCSATLTVISTNLEYRTRERQRNRESKRQISEAQREKGGQRSRARDNKKETFFCWKNSMKILYWRWEKWEMIAATNARWKWGAVKKKKWTRTHTTTFPPKNV